MLKHSYIKIIHFVLLLTIIFNGCSSFKDNNELYFENIKWYNSDELVFNNGMSVSFTKYDSINNTLTNELSFPINSNDSTLIYTRYQKQGVFNEDKEYVITHFEKLVDTVKYDLKYINKEARLIVYIDPFPLILETNEKLNVPETNNLKSVKFVISNYSIGDKVDRTLLKTRGMYNYPKYSIEDCELIANKDITLKIIGYNTIYAIERRRIEDFRVNEIVKVVSAKLNSDPEFRPMRQWIEQADYHYEFYRWVNTGVTVNLSRSKYVGSEAYKTLVGNNDWTLTYDDSFMQAILIETYKNAEPKSDIIN